MSNFFGPQYDIVIHPDSEFAVRIFMPTRDWATREQYNEIVGLKFYRLRMEQVPCKVEWEHGFLDAASEEIYFKLGKKVHERGD